MQRWHSLLGLTDMDMRLYLSGLSDRDFVARVGWGPSGPVAR